MRFRKRKNLEEETQKTCAEMEIVVPKEHELRQERVSYASRDFARAISCYISSTMANTSLSAVYVLGASFCYNISETPSQLSVSLGVCVLGLIVAGFGQTIANHKFNLARDQYNRAINDFDTWRFANDKEGYVVRNSEKIS